MRSGPVAWIAFFVALGALAFSVAAYRKAITLEAESGGGKGVAGKMAPGSIRGEDATTTQNLTVNDIRDRLSALANDLEDETKDGRKAARAEYKRLRREMESAMRKAQRETREAWEETKPELDKLDKELERSGEEARETLRSALLKLNKRLEQSLTKTPKPSTSPTPKGAPTPAAPGGQPASRPDSTPSDSPTIEPAKPDSVS